MIPDSEGISNLAEEYFRCLHSGDIKEIRRLFLPECDLCCANEDGTYSHISLEKYVELVKSRPSPKSNEYPIFGRVLMLEQSHENVAVIKVDCAVQPRFFTDFLTLVKVDGKWRIAAKVYYLKHEKS